jgi:hypothetical protein
MEVSLDYRSDTRLLVACDCPTFVLKVIGVAQIVQATIAPRYTKGVLDFGIDALPSFNFKMPMEVTFCCTKLTKIRPIGTFSFEST